MNSKEIKILIIGIILALIAGGFTYWLQSKEENPDTKVEEQDQEQKEEKTEKEKKEEKEDENESSEPVKYEKGKYLENLDDSEIKTEPAKKDSTFNQKEKPKKGDLIGEIETNKGTIKLKLFPNQAPKTVKSFVLLAKKGYYDGIIFHRIINNFMIQTGDPKGTGTGGASAWDGKFDNELTPNLSNIPGSLSMANAGLQGGKGTNGSQFFINQIDNSRLDGFSNGKPKDCSASRTSCHSVFGQVFEGMDIVNKIASAETLSGDKPKEEIKMIKVKVYEKK